MRRERRLALLLAAGALALRLGAALITEKHPIFPAYYYTDAQIMHQAGVSVLRAWERGEPAPYPGSTSQRVQAFLLGVLYSATGPDVLTAKAASAVAGAAGVWLLFEAALPVFGAAPALAAAAALAVWPSHAFYTSQNFKDAYVMLFLYLSWAAILRLLEDKKPRPVWAAVGALALIGLGLWRPLLMLLSAGAAGAASLAARRWLALGAVCAGLLLYKPVSYALFMGPLSYKPDVADNDTADPKLMLKLITPVNPKAGGEASPATPQGLAQIRRERLAHDRRWAQANRGREVGTQLFPDLDFDSWLDVLLFIPKGMFYVLFMPLPLLYPAGGSLGRMLSSVENLALLVLVAAGAARAARGPWTSGRAALALFFFTAAAGSAIMEFDLGGASRHRLQYASLILAFAFAGRRKK